MAALPPSPVTTVSTVFGRWPDLVGEHLVDHVRPLAVEATTLVVAVDEPAWATQVRWLTPDVLAAADRLLGPGALTDLTVRVKPR
ncbi:hypothetical protein BH24ACT3_BH24ACT3_10010 [soil metagenome]